MSIFRVRNLLIHVLPVECELDSCGVETGCDLESGDGTIDCGDSIGCGESCDDDSGGCGDSCEDDSGGCGDSCEDDSGGCGDSCEDDSGGCGDTCGNTNDCGNDITQGCGSPETNCSPAADSGCNAFACSLHFDTICDAGESKCGVISSPCEIPGITGYCNDVVTVGCALKIDSQVCKVAPISIDCEGDSQCHILNSLPLCLPDSKCGTRSLIVATPAPVGVCFRSNEPKLNPNSLADLGVLRRQLTAGLRMVKVREKALASALTPKTAKQIEAAEAVLNGALRVLREQKQFVQGRAAAAKKKAAARKQVAAPKPAAKKARAKKSPAKKGARKK